MKVSNRCVQPRVFIATQSRLRRMGEALGGRSYPHLRIPLASFRLAPLRRLLAQERFQVESWGHYDFRPPFVEWIAPSGALAAAVRLQRLERSSAVGWLAEGMVLKARAC